MKNKKVLFLIMLVFILFIQTNCKNENIKAEEKENSLSEGEKIVYGYVFTANDFRPLEQVKVEETQTNGSITTNEQGFYELSLESVDCDNLIIEFSKEGFESELIKIRDNGKSRQRVDIFLIPELNGNIYYVSPSGDDNNNGSESFPWKTPGYASRQLRPGDTLIIKKGEYIIQTFDSDIIKPSSGNSGNWVLIKGEDGVKVKGENNIMTLLDLSNSSFVKIENLEFTNNNKSFVRDGVEILGNVSKNIILKKVYIHHLDEFGINVKDINYMVVEYSDIKYCGFGAFGGPHGDYGGIRNLKVLSSTFSYSGHYYQGGDGSSRPYDRPDGFGIEQSQGPIEIYDSIFEHNYGDGIDSKSSNTYIHHCIVANNSCDGVKLWRGNSKIENTLIYGTGDGMGGDSPWAGIVIDCDREGDSFEINGVTLHDNEERRAYPIYVQYDSSASVKVRIINSIFSGGFGHLWFRENVNLTMEYNLIYIPSRDDQVYANGRLYSQEDVKNGILGDGNIFGDPKFVNPAWGNEGDYHLKSDSPAIDKAQKSTSLSDDLEHTRRPIGSGSDMGAYESK